MHSSSRNNKSQCPISTDQGILYVVATPIGNLEDITFRALKTLEAVDIVAAEDTRNTARLLNHFGISKKLVSCHEHNEASRVEYIIGELKAGKSVAIVSDAGTPLVSDPGYRLIEAAAAEFFRIVPIPGPSSLLAALSVSGLTVDRFIFMGFPPRQSGKRKAFIKAAKDFQCTAVFFESPHRVRDFISDILEVIGDRAAVVARELTKIHEEILRGTLSSIHKELSGRDILKGEFVLLVEILSDKDDAGKLHIDENDLDDEISSLVLDGLKSSEIAKKISEKFSMPRQVIYSRILELKGR